LAELAQLDRLPDVAVGLVQKELAQRLAASPGERAYGGLAGLLQALFTVQVLRDVSPEVFRPRPKVWSSVVRLALREDRPAGLADAAARARFAQFVRVLFGQRRKTLRRTFAAAVAEIGGAAAVLPADLGARRAEQLTVDELVALWQRCEPDGFGPTD
ncbi:MAG TPA: hypothetical protein ENI87_06210, partial [bacterium]|nr:hypothetical protein [bacterium]